MKKKITTAKKLSLDKETIANLSEEQKNNLQGGAIIDTINVSENSCGCMSNKAEVAAAREEEEIVTAAARSCCKGSC